MIVKQIHKDIQTVLDIPIADDDTVEMVKYKVSQHLQCPLNEIYLFAQQRRQLTLHTLYEDLLKKTDTIHKEDVEHLIADLSLSIDIKKSKDSYTYDDLLNLFDIQKETSIYFPIGHVLRECANPFLCKKKLPFNSVDYKIVKGLPVNLHKTILLDYFPWVDNTLYVVQQDHVEEELHSSYFTSMASLDNPVYLKKQVEQKKDFLSNASEDNIKNTSIRFIKFTILPTHQVSLSLESIFNLLHATETYPMIHYYTGKSVIYKLYTRDKDINNNKIPTLASSVVFHTGDKDIKVKSVNVYLDNRNISVLFYENGSISVSIKKSRPIAEEDLNREIQKILLPILSIIKEPVYQSGYLYPWDESSNLFATNSTNVRIDAIEYVLQSDVNILHYKNKMKYIANVCLDVTILDEEDKFIYIYTSEYDSNKLYEQIVKYLMSKLNTEKKVIDKLKNMFHLPNNESAKKIITDYAPSSETSMIHQINISMGFKVSFQSSPPSIIVEGINNIHYLPSIKTNFNCIANTLMKEVQETIAQPVGKKVEVIEDFEDAFGGAIEDLDDKPDPTRYNLKNPNFAVTRLKSKYTLEVPDGDYNKKCLRQFVPILISKKEWESEKYQKYRERLEKMENGDKYVSLHDDHVLVCPKFWSFKKTKAYLDAEDFETPRAKNDIFEFNNVNKKETRYKLDQYGEYYEYPTYHESENISNPAKYPHFMKGNVPCCGKLLHKKKEIEHPKELTTSQYIVGKVEPIDTKEKVFKFGYLPEPLCDFFNLVDKKVFRLSTSTTPYEMLRCGIPNKQYQFLHTMHAIYNFNYSSSIDFKTYVQKMKDDFKYVQNGNLFNKYLSFNDFIKDSKNITHEDGWDLVSRLHKQNIIIFKDNDDFVEIVCPSTSKKIDDQKPCVLLYYFEKDNCYEPIIKKPQNKDNIDFTFNTQDAFIKEAIETIRETYKKCIPVIDYQLNDGYTPIPNILSTEMYDILYDKYDEIQQVSQYNKCVGFVVENYFIPCYPSELIQEVDELETPPLQDVESTLDFLNRTHTLKIPCRPYYKVINTKNEITGLLTETFHYVPCISMKNTKKIKLDPYYGNLKHEFIHVKYHTKDKDRIHTTNRIKYEQYGFNYCKNQLMIALNLHAYVTHRNHIKKIIHSTKSYAKKVEEVIDHIHDVLDKHLRNKIEWVDHIPEEYIDDMLDQCPNGFCNSIQKMYLPKINVVTKEKNDYYKRLADDLIRNKQIELFILKPEIQFYVPYQAQDQELILDVNVIETYLDNLEKPTKNKKYYDNANIVSSELHKQLVFHVDKVGKIIITE